MSIRNQRVGEIMTTALITMKASEMLSEADAEMKLANIRHIPVVDDTGHVLGILSSRDIARAFGPRRGHSLVVGEIMSKGVRTVSETTTASDAAELMIEHKISSLPVLGDESQLIGMVTATDLLRVAYLD